MKLPGFLNNKYLFYALAVLASLNVLGYVTVQAWECLALFVLAAYSAQCYCKNKSASILAALFVSNFVFGCGRVKEGFQEGLAACLASASQTDCTDKTKYTADGLKGGAACVFTAAVPAKGTPGDKNYVAGQDSSCAAPAGA